MNITLKPRKPKTSVLHVRLPEADKAKLEAIAEDHQTTVSDLIREALAQAGALAA